MMNNYFVWTLMKSLSEFLSWEYRLPGYQFREETRRVRSIIPTWQKCIEFIEDNMPLLLVALFVDTHVNKTAKQHVSSLSNVTVTIC